MVVNHGEITGVVENQEVKILVSQIALRAPKELHGGAGAIATAES
jgi:hypothetical protein